MSRDLIFDGTHDATTSVVSRVNYAGNTNIEGQIDVTAASGGSPTLDVTIEDSLDSKNWTLITGGTFAQKTTTGIERITITGVKADHVRMVATIGGSGPSFTYTVRLVGK